MVRAATVSAAATATATAGQRYKPKLARWPTATQASSDRGEQCNFRPSRSTAHATNKGTVTTHHATRRTTATTRRRKRRNRRTTNESTTAHPTRHHPTTAYATRQHATRIAVKQRATPTGVSLGSVGVQGYDLPPVPTSVSTATICCTTAPPLAPQGTKCYLDSYYYRSYLQGNNPFHRRKWESKSFLFTS